MRNHKLQKVIKKLNAKKKGKEYWAICPAHNDNNPSLTFREKDGKTVFKCRAGCSQESVIKALQDKGVFSKQIADKSRIAHSIYNESTNCKDSKIAKKYIKNRGIKLKGLKYLRFNPKLSHAGKEYAGFVIKTFNNEDKHVGILRVFIDKDGNKALPSNKMVIGPSKDCHLKIGEPKETLAIAEGFETAVSIFNSTQIPVRCTLGVQNYQSLKVPKSIKNLYIFSDNDKNQQGQIESNKLAERLSQEIDNVYVLIPPKEGYDWLDVKNKYGVEFVKNFTQNVDRYIYDSNTFENSKPLGLTQEDELPEFPIEVFPSFLLDFIEKNHAEIQISKDFISIGLLGTLSTSSSRAFTISPENQQDYYETTNLWLFAFMESGNRKSSALSKCIEPLAVWENKQNDLIKGVIKETQSKFESEKAIIDSKRKRLGKKGSNDEELKAEIEELEKNITKVPTLISLIENDITVEQLGRVMAENHERIGIIEAESNIIKNISGMYSKGQSNFSTLLKMWSGEPVKTSRVGRDAIHMFNPHATFCVTPQPSILKDLKKVKGSQDEGLIPRFLFSFPKSSLGQRRARNSAKFDSNINVNYEQKILKLSSTVFNFLDEHSDRKDNEWKKSLVLSKKARELYYDYIELHEKKLLEGNELFELKAWASKLTGNLLRISAILHIAKVISKNKLNNDPFKDEALIVKSKEVKNAIKVANYFIEHAKYAYKNVLANKITSNAIHIDSWYTRKRLEVFSKRDCQNENSSRFQKANEVQDALDYLELKGRIIKVESTNKRSVNYRVHPTII